MSTVGQIRPLKCNRCGHRWFPRSPEKPDTCPHKLCRSPYWNKKRVRNLNPKPDR